VFYVNVPIGLVIIAILARMLPRQTAATPRLGLDVVGALLVTASSGALIYAFIRAGDDGWLTSATGLLILLAAIGYVAFVFRQRTARSPMMDVSLLVRRPVATGTFLILMATALMIAVFFLGTFYFQHGEDYGAMRTGLLFLPVALATMVGANLTGRTLAKAGARPLAVAGLLTAAIGMALPALVLNPVTAVIGTAIAGAGTGAMFVVASATALGQVAPHESGIASGIVSTFHEFGASIGAAVISSVAAASLTGDTLDGFTDGFVLAAITATVAAAASAALTPPRPREPLPAND
jgi:hypothetical protein